MMGRTLLEKMDSSLNKLSLEESVCRQVERIVSTRIYREGKGDSGSFVTAFGVPELVGAYEINDDSHEENKKTICKQIKTLEPRIEDVEVKAIDSMSGSASCQLKLKIKESVVEEQFHF